MLSRAMTRTPAEASQPRTSAYETSAADAFRYQFGLALRLRSTTGAELTPATMKFPYSCRDCGVFSPTNQMRVPGTRASKISESMAPCR